MNPFKVLADWVRADVDRACAATVSVGLGGIALAGSATHILRVGEYPDVRVTGWMVWTVAGSLEVLAAYAAWEVRRRKAWDRVIPVVVLVVGVTFVVLANLAAADQGSWAARLPWAQAFAVAPPVGFISVCAIAETRGWERPKRRSQRKVQTPGKPQVSDPEPSTVNPPQGGGSLHALPDPADPSGPTVRPGEDRATATARWVQEGHAWKVMIDASTAHFGGSVSTAKRAIQTARGSTSAAS